MMLPSDEVAAPVWSECPDLLSCFAAETGCSVRTQASTERATTLQVGAPFAVLAEPDSIEQLCNVASFLRERECSFRILGAGSNLLLPDQPLAMWVLRLGRGLRAYQLRTSAIEAKCVVWGAMPLMTLARELSQQGWAGLEFASGIPGTVGGAVRMNAGAHGGEMSQIIREVRYVDAAGQLITVGIDQLSFAYRSCSIPADALICEATLVLRKETPAAVMQRRAEFMEYRKRTQPLSVPSSGSVFVNPSREVSAGQLIEQAGLKGLRIGGAQISPLHANWITNPERVASAADVEALIQRCRDVVWENSGVELKTELVRW